MPKPKLTVLLSLVLLFHLSHAQNNRPKIKYGDILEKDFEAKMYDVDTSAQAVYLFDVGESYYKEDFSGSFDVVYKKHTRIRLLNKNSFDLATVEIPLYKYGSSEQLISNLEATTYNVENNKVVATKVDKNSFFKDKGEYFTMLKFTFPNLKEGSIIEFKYEITSPSPLYIRGWNFQGSYPKLWSEYKVAIPDFFDFVKIAQGYLPYNVDTLKTLSRSFARGTVGGNIVEHTWAIQNVTSLKKEEFTTTLDNHISKLEFQLSLINMPNRPSQPIMQNWMEFAKMLMESEDFGEVLKHPNNWLDDDVKLVTAGVKDDQEKAKKIFEFIRDNYICIDDDAVYLSQPIKKTYQAKKGNVVDINILLAAMLKNAGFDTHPVLLSTRNNGYASETYPIISKFNYVIVQALKDKKEYLLDASDPSIGFNHLPAQCYNGTGRVIDEMPLLIDLSADSLKESKVTTVFMMNDEKGISASFTSKLGDLESQSIRRKLKKATEESFFTDIKKSYTMEVDISKTSIDSLKKPEEPLSIKYEMSFSPGDEDVFYFSPMLAESQTENPFKAADRLYPVEMDACMNETYILNMEIPKGYVVEEMPKSTRVMLNEDEGMFEYIIGISGDHIQLRCRTSLNKANFNPEDYATLRDFFAYIVKKEAEQIVFKKK